MRLYGNLMYWGMEIDRSSVKSESPSSWSWPESAMQCNATQHWHWHWDWHWHFGITFFAFSLSDVISHCLHFLATISSFCWLICHLSPPQPATFPQYLFSSFLQLPLILLPINKHWLPMLMQQNARERIWIRHHINTYNNNKMNKTERCW